MSKANEPRAFCYILTEELKVSNKIIVVCNEPHSIDPSKCAFCEIESLKAKIDALMFEYCPDEMTPEQLKNWEAHQRPAPVDLPPLL